MKINRKHLRKLIESTILKEYSPPQYPYINYKDPEAVERRMKGDGDNDDATMRANFVQFTDYAMHHIDELIQEFKKNEPDYAVIEGVLLTIQEKHMEFFM